MIWDVDPEIFRLGPIAVRWYSLAFIVGFLLGYQYMIRTFLRRGYDNEDTAVLASSIFTHLFLGTLIGARLGHCLFYEPVRYLSEPWTILMVWEGGLASHGGYIGVAIGIFMFTRKYGKMSFFWAADRVAPTAMLTGGFIRIGNLFNSEMIGHPTDVPWALVFKRIDSIARHPAMLYEAAAYLVVALIGFLAIEKFQKTWKDGSFLGLVLALGMAARFVMEFFKENQVGFEEGMAFNMGQLLSIPFVLIGIYLLSGRQANNPVLAFLSSVSAGRVSLGGAASEGVQRSAAPTKKKANAKGKKGKKR